MLFPKIANRVFNFWLLWDAQNSEKPTWISQIAVIHKNKELSCTSHNQKHEVHLEKFLKPWSELGLAKHRTVWYWNSKSDISKKYFASLSTIVH